MRLRNPEIRAAVSRLGVAARCHPEQVEDRRRELEETRLEVLAREYVANWPWASDALLHRLYLVLHPGGAE